MRFWTGLIVVLLAVGCDTVPRAPELIIVGTWRGDVAGVPVVYEYTDSTVRVVGHDAVPYQIDDGVLTLLVEGGSERTVVFPTRDEMIQTDPLTGTELKLLRVN